MWDHFTIFWSSAVQIIVKNGTFMMTWQIIWGKSWWLIVIVGFPSIRRLKWLMTSWTNAWTIRELCVLDSRGPNSSQLEGSSGSGSSGSSSFPIRSRRGSVVNFEQSSGEETSSNLSWLPCRKYTLIFNFSI